MPPTRSKAFIIHDILQLSDENTADQLNDLTVLQLLALRKNIVKKQVDESEMGVDTTAMTTVELKERAVYPTRSLFDLFRG